MCESVQRRTRTARVVCLLLRVLLCVLPVTVSVLVLSVVWAWFLVSRRVLVGGKRYGGDDSRRRRWLPSRRPRRWGRDLILTFLWVLNREVIKVMSNEKDVKRRNWTDVGGDGWINGTLA
jgi:hypothetical protein